MNRRMSPHFPTLLAFAAVSVARGADLYPDEVLKDGPVGYFRFEGGETEGGRVRNAAAAAVRGGDGVIGQGVQLVSGGVVGKAASFDGRGVMKIPSHPAFDSEIVSVELWFRSTQAFERPYWPGSASLVSKVTPGNGSGDWCILGGSKDGGRNDGQILVGIGPKGGSDHVLESATGLNDGQFHHVVWTRGEDGQNRLYVDGMLKVSLHDGGGKIGNTRAIHVGGEMLKPGGSFFKGEIDELAIYAGVLPEDRVKAHFAVGRVDPRLAKGASHWSFKPLKRPPVPRREDAWVTSPVDAFILEKLDAAKLSPAPPADKEALLRRVSFDLTGLPPSPEQITAFASDTSADAFAPVVDQLLASPAYGERWARHWLDVMRYADSGGYETDIFYEQAWRFRDYVIRSFNGDKPYDRFLMEQVAGDELWPEQADMQDAVAVWTLGEWQNALDAFPDMLEYVRRTDQVSLLSEAALGLTVGCANCHNHKFDPITQRDYFGMEAIFAASETWNRNTGEKAWGKGERTAFRAMRHAERPIPIHLLTRGELTKPTKLIAPALPAFLPGGGALPGGPDEAKQRRARLARWLVSPENPLTARVIANRIWQWHFGQAIVSTPNDFGTQGDPPSHPELLEWLATELCENGWSLKGLHRRILLSSAYQQSAIRDAKAVAADPQNRWLAGFPRRRLEAEEVWDHLHAAAGTLDLKRFGPPFVPKLSPEELQGMYDLENKPELKWPVTHEQDRRAIYILNRRSFRFPFFEAFDPPNIATSCPVRQTTTMPTQALTLLNNRIVGEQARAMAGRLTREAGGNVGSFVKRAWLLAYSRAASESELKLAVKFIEEAEAARARSGATDAHAAALEEFCMGIMNTTEFIYTN